jgi:hypothetical protein
LTLGFVYKPKFLTINDDPVSARHHEARRALLKTSMESFSSA